MTKTIIAMWSGPRNLSTAMMRAFENRNDTEVLDEPFYAHYLSATGLDHPGRDMIIDSQSTDWNEVVDMCTNSDLQERPIWYQKHMAQHNLEGFDISWVKDVTNCLLIRDPKYVIASYGKKFPIEDERLLGYIQQTEIIEFLEKENGMVPPIIDADDILRDPEIMLKKLCQKIGIDFSLTMLSWPKGPRESDGIWAPYWYEGVQDSTGFQPYAYREVILDDDLIEIYDNCMNYYDAIHQKRIRP
jgi:hypothetical protein